MNINHLLLAPHNDDEGLFCSYIIQRFNPLVLVITDASKHEEKFGKSYGILVRQSESVEAMKELGATVKFLGIKEHILTNDILKEKLSNYSVDGRVFAPALQGGNPDHDLTSNIATELWGNRVIYYSTYSKGNLVPTGQIAIFPKGQEEENKKRALSKYISQIKINPHHFEAVKNQPEFINIIQTP